MAEVSPTSTAVSETTRFLNTRTSMESLNPDLTHIIMEYNQTTLQEMMMSYPDCFGFSNDTALQNGPENNDNGTMFVSIQPLNNANCSLFQGNTSIESNITVTPGCNPNQEYFSWSYALVGTLFQSIILVVGVLGNVLTCTVVQRTRSMHTTTNCYLVSLSVADTITLVSTVPQEILSYHIIGNLWVWGHFTCKIYVFLNNLGINASALSLTAFTIERYIAICHPIRAKSICRVSRANKIIVGCWIFAIIYCTPWFFIATTKTFCVDGIEGEMLTCSFSIARNSTTYVVIFIVDIVMYYVFPLVLSVVLYLLIARVLLVKAKNSILGGCHRGATIRADPAQAKTQSNRVQVVKMLACVVMIFATMWLPYRGMLVYNSFVEVPFFDLWYLMFAKTCIYINCAINPILYNAMSDRFRKAFRALLVCRDGSGRSEQRLCMTGYTTNNIDRSTYEANVNTRVTRIENSYNSVTPGINTKTVIKQHESLGSGSCLRKAAAEAAAKNNLTSDSILACSSYSKQNTKQTRAHFLNDINEGRTETYKDGKETHVEIVNNTVPKNSSISEISNHQNHRKTNRRHHHHHHHHHHHSQNPNSIHQDKTTDSDKCNKHKCVRNNHSTCADKMITCSKLHKKELIKPSVGVYRLNSSCSLTKNSTTKNCRNCSAKSNNFKTLTKVNKTLSAPSGLSTFSPSKHHVGYKLSKEMKFKVLSPNLKIESFSKEENDEDGEEHQILVKLNGRYDRSLCQIYDAHTNYACTDIAITDTKVTSVTNANSNKDVTILVDGNSDKNYNQMNDSSKKDHESSGISSSASSPILTFDSINNQEKKPPKQPLQIKAGLNKKHLSNYITEVSFSTAL